MSRQVFCSYNTSRAKSWDLAVDRELCTTTLVRKDRGEFCLARQATTIAILKLSLT